MKKRFSLILLLGLAGGASAASHLDQVQDAEGLHHRRL